MVAFKNTKTDEELDKLFDKVDSLKKLINTVFDIPEKKRINNIIKS